MSDKIDAFSLEGIIGMLVMKLNRTSPDWERIEVAKASDGAVHIFVHDRLRADNDDETKPTMIQ